MNLSLLFWAAKESSDPRFMHVARAHADTVVRHFIREDGSTYHIVRFNPETGEWADAIGGQGAAPESAWSRGAAWALYGMTNAYTHTGDETYLRAAQRVANFFIAHLPEDGVPYWDFRAEEEDGGIPRDSSAGACAASGLIDLAGHLGDTQGEDIVQQLNVSSVLCISLTEHGTTVPMKECSCRGRETVLRMRMSTCRSYMEITSSSRRPRS